MNRIFLFFLLFPQLSFASVFEANPSDKSMGVLASIFGNLSNFGNGGEDPLYSAISTLNSAVLIVGGILLAYTIILATIETANDGEMMGKRLSSIWVPIRIALGSALVMPIFKGGYCLVQIVISWMIMQGIGLANSAWNGYVSVSGVNVIKDTDFINVDAKNFGYNVFKSYVCIEVGQKFFPNIMPKIKKIDTATSTVYEFGFNEESGFKSDSCGVVEIPNINQFTPEKEKIFSYFQSDAYLKELVKSPIIAKTNIEASNILLNSMQNLAQNMVKSGTVIPISNVDYIIKNYISSLQQAVKNEEKRINESPVYEKTNYSDGWLLAGFYYNKIFNKKELIQKYVFNNSVATGPNYIDNRGFYEKYIYYQALLSQTFGDISVIETKLRNGNEDIKGKLISKEDSNKIIKKMIFSDLGENYFEMYESENPLLTAKRLGSWLANISSNALSYGFGSMLSNNNSVATGIQTILFIFVVPLILIGGFLSYIVPMLPTLIWIIAISGWLILCLEGVIFAPIWAIMHMNPHGEDLVGKGGNGYKIILGLLLRPIIMTSGLIAAFVLLEVIGKIINQIFYGLLAISEIDTKIFSMLISLMFVSLLYGIAVFILSKNLFSMIYIIPEKLMLWIDGGNNTSNSYVNTIKNDTPPPTIPTQINNLVNSISGIIDTGKSILTGNFHRQDHKSLNSKRDYMHKDFEKEYDKEFSKEFGKEGMVFIDYASNGGKNKINGAAASNALSNQVNVLGGKETIGTINFLQKLNQSIEDEMKKLQHEQANWKDVFGGVSRESLNNEFGEGASDILGRVGGGGLDKNGKTKISLLGPKFLEGALIYQRKSSKLKKKGMSHEEVVKLLSEVNKKILYLYASSPKSIKNGGNKTIEDFMNEEFSKINF